MVVGKYVCVYGEMYSSREIINGVWAMILQHDAVLPVFEISPQSWGLKLKKTTDSVIISTRMGHRLIT